MIFRKMLTKKAAKVVEVVAEPARKAMAEQLQSAKNAVGEHSDWGAKVVKFGIALLMLIITFREDRNDISKADRVPALPGNIIINNYINDPNEDKERSNTK